MGNTTSLNNEFKNDLSINTAIAGKGMDLIIENTDNTNAASHAKLQLTTGGSSGGNPYIELTNAITTWTMGLDNADEDKFKIAASNALATTTTFKDELGNITRPLQPSFFAYRSATVTNVTGNGASFTIVFDTEKFDTGADYNNGNGTFTAPVTGKYFFSTNAFLTGITIATTIATQLVTTGATSPIARYTRPAANTDISSHVEAIIPLTAGNTVHVVITAYGEAGNTDDLIGGSNYTWFCGMLLQ